MLPSPRPSAPGVGLGLVEAVVEAGAAWAGVGAVSVWDFAGVGERSFPDRNEEAVGMPLPGL
jgi:hypothetical protein